MKILTVSDVVVPQLQVTELPQRFREVDLILACGDLPFDYLEYLVTRLGKRLYYVFGNHAQRQVLGYDGRRTNAPGGCENIHGRVINHNGLLIGGLEGSLLYNRGPHQYSEWQMRLMMYRMAPRLWLNRLRYGRAIDILVTHAAPKGLGDAEDLPHRGFQAFLSFMDRYRPRYLIHGHVHLYRPDTPRVRRYGETKVINTYGYQIITVEKPDATSAGTPGRQEKAEPAHERGSRT